MKPYPRTFSGRIASQIDYELTNFIGFLKTREVTRYLEVGAREGDTFHEVMINLPKGSLGVAVDLPCGLWGRKGTDKKLEAAVADLRSRGYDAHFVLGDSRAFEIVDRVKSLGPFDAALIDGDHTYDGVKADWENYGPMAPVVAFHDIVGSHCVDRHTGTPVDVPRLWNEIQGLKGEFVARGSNMGIGVIERVI